MASKTIDVVIKVRDAASKPLKDVETKLKNTGSAAKNAEMDFTKFNKTLFATTAFINTFRKGFEAVFSVMDRGAELDRINKQFERVVGSKGDLFKSISKFTDNSIDKFEAMKQGIALKSMGIVSNTEKIAEIMAKAGTAAKLAGTQSGEGVKHFSEFLKDGSVNHLQFLNLIAKSNPALQAQMAILQKSGGVMGGVLSMQARLAMGMQLLNAATKDQLFGQRDLADVMAEIKESFFFMRGAIGGLLSSALGPLIGKFKDLIWSLTFSIEKITKTDKNIVALSKGVLVLTGALSALIATLGSLRLMSMLLSSVGLGLPKLIFSVIAMGSAFLGVTSTVDGVVNKLKLFAAFYNGIVQLITSLDPETGIAKMDKSIHDLLKKNGLLTLAQNIARVGSVMKTFITDSINGIKTLANFLDNTFGGISRKLIGFLDSFKEPWKNFWVNENASFMTKALRWVTVAATIGGSVFALIKGFGLFNKVMTKIPVIGKLFGGGMGGKGPSGTASDPIYVTGLGGKGILDSENWGGMSGKKSGKWGTLGKIGKFLASPKGVGIATAAIGLPGLISNMFGETSTKEKVEGAANFAGTVGGGVAGMLLGGPWGALAGSMTGGPAVEKLAGWLYDSVTAKDKDISESKKSDAIIPKMPESEEDKINLLGETLQTVESNKKAQFQQSIEGALATTSVGGATITPDEWISIFMTALDRSQNIKKIADKELEKLGIPSYDRRGAW